MSAWESAQSKLELERIGSVYCAMRPRIPAPG